MEQFAGAFRCGSLLLLTAVLLQFSFTRCNQGWDEAVWADFDKNYSATTDSNGSLSIYKYNVNKSDVVRVLLNSDATSDWPLLTVFREQRAIISVQLPIEIQKSYLYESVARTLCPFATADGAPDNGYFLSVELSSYRAANYSLIAFHVKDFALQLNVERNLSTSPSEPIYFQFDIPENLDSVMVNVRSDNTYCMTVSVQPVGCPVFDLQNNVISVGMHQTMTTSASIAVQRRAMQSFYVVFVVKPNDDDCSEFRTIRPRKPIRHGERMKNFTVMVTELPTDRDYAIPLAITVAIIVVVYIIGFTFMFCMGRYERRLWMEQARSVLSLLVDESASNSLLGARREESYGTVRVEEGPSTSSTTRDQGTVIGDIIEPGPSSSLLPDVTEDEYDTLNDRLSEKAVIRAKANLTVADLSQKTWKQRNKKYKRYAWSLITIALFYGLPVVQLVFTWLNTVRASGDLDLCWYNFRCARPMLGFVTFNSVFSNIGYVFLGLLLLIMVKHRERRYQEILNLLRGDDSVKYGIPVHNGLMYAIGISIMMEGIMSASYHVCPSSSNYQFDTSFMYIIGALGMLKIYQLRHPDISANAHVSFMVLAMFIFVAMCGVYFDNLPFWIVFAVLYIFIMFSISVEFYYKGQWRFKVSDAFRSVRYAFYSSVRCSMLLPRYKGRFVFLVVANGLNLAYVTIGVLNRPKDFPSFLILPFIGNLFLYLMYYIVMKLIHRERLVIRSLVFFVLGFVFWCAAMALFVKHSVADWSETAARSRELNGDCILFNFYDSHDAWHFLSAFAMFLSFAAIISIDDDLFWVPRDKIAAF